MRVAIVGSRGFIGQHLVAQLLADGAHTLVHVNRTLAAETDAGPRVTARTANVLDAASLLPALADAEVVINLAWPSNSSPESWTRNLAKAVQASGARQIIHCSTAVVAGRTTHARVNEHTPPLPTTGYERAKLQAEKQLSEQLAGHVPLIIARPTVVFGPGGQNLVSLAQALRRGSTSRDLVRRALFWDRPMHLIPVATVAGALAFLIGRQMHSPTVVQIAADDDPENTYLAVEKRLRAGLQLPSGAVPRLALPSALLRLALRLRGRSDADPRRRYAGDALTGLGFEGHEPVGPAVERFGRWMTEGSEPAC